MAAFVDLAAVQDDRKCLGQARDDVAGRRGAGDGHGLLGESGHDLLGHLLRGPHPGAAPRRVRVISSGPAWASAAGEPMACSSASTAG
jgi:hypothetical protein